MYVGFIVPYFDKTVNQWEVQKYKALGYTEGACKDGGAGDDFSDIA